MEPVLVSFPPQRSHCNELPVPPLLVIIPAARSLHKRVTIMLTTRPCCIWPARAEGQMLVKMRKRGGAVCLVCTLVRLCVVMRG